jgi:hypothetical protein
VDGGVSRGDESGGSGEEGEGGIDFGFLIGEAKKQKGEQRNAKGERRGAKKREFFDEIDSIWRIWTLFLNGEMIDERRALPHPCPAANWGEGKDGRFVAL